jgi:hypothetical protein
VSRLLSLALFYQVSSIFSSGSVRRALCSFLIETLQVTEVLEIREELEADAKWPVICHSMGTRLRQLRPAFSQHLTVSPLTTDPGGKPGATPGEVMKLSPNYASVVFERFWLKTIGLCTAAALALALGIAIVSTTAVLVFAAPQSVDLPISHLMAGNPQTFSGVVTDAHCGAKHTTESGQNAAGCTRLCVKTGSSYALVSGETVMGLNGDAGFLDRFAGQRVKVWGSLEGSEIRVDSVELMNR